MSLDIGKLGTDMGAAFLNSLKDKAPDIEAYAKGEGVKMAQCLATIASLTAAGTISEAFQHQGEAIRAFLRRSNNFYALYLFSKTPG